MNHEDDYMSDTFLKQLSDVRPGLAKRGGKRRGRHVDGGGSSKKQKQNVTENKALEAALATPIPESNKGYLMLQRMGYKDGTGLGKQGGGRLAPVPISLKDGRDGLGKRAFVEEKKVHKQQQSVKSVGEFRQMKQDEFVKRRVRADMRKSQLACHQLDTARGTREPEEEWFWPVIVGEEESEEAEDQEEAKDSMDSMEKLALLTKYLRSTHFYCIWCGTAFDDMEDLDQNCPGDNAESHD